MNCESMVYLNKIFSNLEVQSCPLLGELTASSETFDQQLSFFHPADCGSGCSCGGSCIEFDDDLNFVIENTQVFVSDFALEDPTSLTAENVTVNGVPVDGLSFEGGRFTASVNTLLQTISNCTCLERGASTKALLLIREAGPWVAKITIVIHGSVFGCGGCSKFKLIMTTRDGISINVPGASTFAVSDICLPCTAGGIAPVIRFSFLADASLLNPVIITDTGSGTCNVILTGSLVTEPAAAIQVTRETLFSIDAEAVPLPCDDLCRCIQSPGVCTCQPEPMPAYNPCCDTCADNADGTVPFIEDSCGCGCSGSSSFGCSNQSRHNEDRQICCQFNDCNGCIL